MGGARPKGVWDLAGTTAVVTGGSKGIGLAVVDELLSQAGLNPSEQEYCAGQLAAAGIDHAMLARACAIGPEFLQGVLKDEGLTTGQSLRLILALKPLEATGLN